LKRKFFASKLAIFEQVFALENSESYHRDPEQVSIGGEELTKRIYLESFKGQTNFERPSPNLTYFKSVASFQFPKLNYRIAILPNPTRSTPQFAGRHTRILKYFGFCEVRPVVLATGWRVVEEHTGTQFENG
jgi:hypothetical protein